MMKKIINCCVLLLVALASMTSCDKVSPTGVLIGGTGVDDRVKMSILYYQQHKGEFRYIWSDSDEYTFLVGADSHLATDTNRLAEMFDTALVAGDKLIAHLGDIADTKPEYYISLDNTINDALHKWLLTKFKYSYYNEFVDEWYYSQDSVDWADRDTYSYYLDGETFPFYPVVGNHDITHNGWAMWSSLFGSSFYTVDVYTPHYKDHYIFLDSANGTLGSIQADSIESNFVYNLFYGDDTYRYTFVFTHTNIFRPQLWQFASTFPREETYFLLNKFTEWNTTAVFMGHVHEWDLREIGDTWYVTLPSMGERNSPKPGEYLVRAYVEDDGATIEPVMMNYTPDKK